MISIKRFLWILLGVTLLGIVLARLVNADTDTSTSTLTISPSATSGATILASDENTRNNATTSWANTHVHSLPNTTNFGDGAAGTKSFCADAADSTDRCLRWDDTNDLWVIDQVTAGSFNQILTISGVANITDQALVMGAGDRGRLEEVGTTVHTTVPTTWGDYAVRVYSTVANTITSGTASALTFDAERWDTNTMHSTSSNTSRLTATTAGRYFIFGHLNYETNQTGWRQTDIRLNGTTVIASTLNHAIVETGTPLSIATHYNLAANDYVELFSNHNGATTLDVQSIPNESAEFGMVKAP